MPDEATVGLGTKGNNEPVANDESQSRQAPQRRTLHAGDAAIAASGNVASTVAIDPMRNVRLPNDPETNVPYEKSLLAEERATVAWDSFRRYFFGGLIYSCVLGLLYFLMASAQGGSTGQSALSTAIGIGFVLAGPAAVYLAILKRLPFLVIGVGLFGFLLSIFLYGIAPFFILAGTIFIDFQIGFPLLTIALIVIPYAFIIYAMSRSISARHHARKVAQILEQPQR